MNNKQLLLCCGIMFVLVVLTSVVGVESTVVVLDGESVSFSFGVDCLEEVSTVDKRH